jgi:hypothetical protein
MLTLKLFRLNEKAPGGTWPARGSETDREAAAAEGGLVEVFAVVDGFVGFFEAAAGRPFELHFFLFGDGAALGLGEGDFLGIGEAGGNGEGVLSPVPSGRAQV